MAKTGKRFSFPRIQLPAETIAALKRAAELHRELGIPNLKRLLRHLSPAEREAIGEVKRLRRELARKAEQLRQLEEWLDHELGERWWDDHRPAPLAQPVPSKKGGAVPTTAPAAREQKPSPAHASAPVAARVRGKEQKRIAIAVSNIWDGGPLPDDLAPAQLAHEVFDWEMRQARAEGKPKPEKEPDWKAANRFIKRYR